MSRSPLGRSFGNVAEVYARVRPEYPDAALDRAAEALELEADARVVDLAAGTGKLTQALARRFASVIAVEPDDAMRALIAHDDVLVGTAESIPLPDDNADALFVGEAFHWFDAGAARSEIARVLRPRGGLALISNQWWRTEPPIPEAAQKLLREPFVRSGRAGAGDAWPSTLDGLPFEPLRHETFERELVVAADTLLALYSTTSSIAVLPASERAALLAAVRRLLSGPYRLPIRVELTWTRLAAR